ncbi:MAG: ADP-ribosylglycohydrolase family protein [Bacillota bacterium]|jgi:type I restriction enzyme M protein|nr:ADP-ribosylglycohydrolase family protein [Bacillota bacterium]NLL26331.1 ADP-ribosylglycohydrolase [Erysipelotrichia bacterium]
MLGAIIGDIVGSRFEWYNHKTKDFDLFTEECRFTDDSVMTIAIAEAVLKSDSNLDNLSENAITSMQKFGRKYPYAGYGGNFIRWIHALNPQPYNSWGNGSAMRVSACGFAAKSLEEAVEMSKKVTEVSHNHPEGIKGAEATAVAIYLAKTGSSLSEIKNYINEHYYKIDFKLDDIRQEYQFDVSCQGSVPQALAAFFESNSFEDAIRNAISIGGDSDTIGAITGSIAEAYYGINDEIRNTALKYLNKDLIEVVIEFENRYPTKAKL